jgi:putative oxidoreductase
VALVLGIATRGVALALIPVLLGATWAHAGNGWLFTNPNGGWEYPLFLTLATAVQALLGAGAHALRPGGRGVGTDMPAPVAAA